MWLRTRGLRAPVCGNRKAKLSVVGSSSVKKPATKALQEELQKLTSNYVIDVEAQRLAARAWRMLQGQEASYDKEKAIDLFTDLQHIDEEFYNYNICKFLYYRNDAGFSAYKNRKYGPTQFAVAHGYRWGKGMEPNLDLARHHFEIGAQLGNIPCYISLFSTLPFFSKLYRLPMMLFQAIRFVYIAGKEDYDTRVMR